MADEEKKTAFQEPQYDWNEKYEEPLVVWGISPDLERTYIRRAFERYKELTGNTLDVVQMPKEEFMDVCETLLEEGVTPLYLPSREISMLLYQFPMDFIVGILVLQRGIQWISGKTGRNGEHGPDIEKVSGCGRRIGKIKNNSKGNAGTCKNDMLCRPGAF